MITKKYHFHPKENKEKETVERKKREEQKRTRKKDELDPKLVKLAKEFMEEYKAAFKTNSGIRDIIDCPLKTKDLVNNYSEMTKGNKPTAKKHQHT